MLPVRDRLRAEDLPARLRLLGFPDADLAEVLVATAGVVEQPEELAAVQGMADRLLPVIGRIDDPWDGSLPWPWRSTADSSHGVGVLELLALLATVDEVRAYHASRGIGEDDSWRALSDLGQQVQVHRLTYGVFGLHTHDWLRVAWSGALYWLGRLQFNVQRDPAGEGWLYSTHIPRTGSLTPTEVDASLAWARRFFAEHFPDCPSGGFFCDSWLLDPQLSEVLPAASNMVQFQRRWTLEGEPKVTDDDAIFFTFARRPPVDRSALPRDTTLQRALLDRLEAGGHWRTWRGRIDFGPRRPDGGSR